MISHILWFFDMSSAVPYTQNDFSFLCFSESSFCRLSRGWIYTYLFCPHIWQCYWSVQKTQAIFLAWSISTRLRILSANRSPYRMSGTKSNAITYSRTIVELNELTKHTSDHVTWSRPHHNLTCMVPRLDRENLWTSVWNRNQQRGMSLSHLCKVWFMTSMMIIEDS
jgi:hypothetical protein